MPYGWLIKLAFYAVLAIAAVYLVHKAKSLWDARCGPVCVQDKTKLTSERDKYLKDFNDYRTAQQAYNTQKAQEFDALKAQVAQTAKERDDEIQTRLAAVDALNAKIRDQDARIRVSANTVRLLNSYIDAANGASAPTAAGPAAGTHGAPAAAAPNPGDTSQAAVDDWVRTASGLYARCTQRVADLVGFYQGVKTRLQNAPAVPAPDG